MTNRLAEIHAQLEGRSIGFTRSVPRTPGLLHRLSGVSRAFDVDYSRADAVDYARRFWNVPCSDGAVAISTGKGSLIASPGTRFVHDADGTEHAEDAAGRTVLGWRDLDDCTHFISCCIGRPPQAGEDFTRSGYKVERAGGLNVPSTQMGFPLYGYVRVSSLVEWLLARKIAKAVTTKSSDRSKLSELSAGDLIAYWDPDRRRYQHFTIYLGDGKIACHTVCRSDAAECTWDNDWDLGGDLRWTMLRMPS